MSKTPDQLLHDAAELFHEKGKIYGHTYKEFGAMCAIMFPDGLKLKDANDFNRFALLIQVIHKSLRYTKQFEKGGHLDSVQDLKVYSAMLEELTAENLESPNPTVACSEGIGDRVFIGDNARKKNSSCEPSEAVGLSSGASTNPFHLKWDSISLNVKEDEKHGPLYGGPCGFPNKFFEDKFPQEFE